MGVELRMDDLVELVVDEIAMDGPQGNQLAQIESKLVTISRLILLVVGPNRFSCGVSVEFD